MHIRTFRAPDLRTALDLIRAQMGPDAQVLHTREIPAPWWSPLAKKQLEVTAGLRSANSTQTDTASETPGPSLIEEPAEWPLLGGHDGSHHAAEHASTASEEPQSEQDSREAWAADLVASCLADEGLPLSIAQAWLSHARVLAPSLAKTDDLSDVAANSWCEAPNDWRWSEQGRGANDDLADRLEAAMRRRLARWLATVIPIGPAIQPRYDQQTIVAVVGATGVGKTTTVAKLAAGFRMRKSATVGLVTLDTYRAAGIEQLEAYADALRVPLEVVRHVDDVDAALNKLSELDIVLVDTGGQSPRATDRLDQLGTILARVGPTETHLVLDATSSIAATRACLQSFAALRPSGIIISKTDEVEHGAAMMAPVLEQQSAITYVTTGQSVPADLRVADAETLGSWISGLAAM